MESRRESDALPHRILLRMTMSQTTVSREVVVGIPEGLHARPADLLAREAQRWQSRIEFVGAAQRVDGKSILDLLTLAAEAGTRLEIGRAHV